MKAGIIPITLIELNTMSDPWRGFRDESPRRLCRKCGHYFLLGKGMDESDPEKMITAKHIELCEGDAAVTLMKIEQWWKEKEKEGNTHGGN